MMNDDLGRLGFFFERSEELSSMFSGVDLQTLRNIV